MKQFRFLDYCLFLRFLVMAKLSPVIANTKAINAMAITVSNSSVDGGV